LKLDREDSNLNGKCIFICNEYDIIFLLYWEFNLIMHLI